MLTQVQDFATECDVLADLLARLSPDDWNRPTAFKGWTPNEIVVHLHFWNMAVDLTQRDGEALHLLADRVVLFAEADQLAQLGFKLAVLVAQG